MLTIAEIAKRHDLPESTARYYCKRFRRFLPHVGEGKRRRYLEESLPVFEIILAEMADSKNATAVEAKLEQRFPAAGGEERDIREHLPAEHRGLARSFPEQKSDFEALFKRQTDAIEQIASALKLLSQETRRSEQSINVVDNEPVIQRMEQLEKGIDSLRQEMGALRTLQDQAERIHQQDLEQLRKWLSHLAKEQSKDKN